ncbi:MAG: DUF2249 domain-containing protein [Alphaproteobacteria bacterium]|nr:DUF2249 domain-containing protein [Alphaproteobacteria bacterium]
MTQSYIDLDVRPILRNGGEPFGKIMDAVTALAPDQGLRLYATFKPVPLFSVLEAKGFIHEAKEIGGGDWEVLFRRGGKPEMRGSQAAPAASTAGCPDPIQHMDNRDLEPPVLSALLRREPMFLFPQLAKRGHIWRGGFEPDGVTYKILIRAGHVSDAA